MNPKIILKKIRYLLEAIIVKFGLFFFYALSPKKASDIGAIISKFVGKKIAVHNLAYKNLSKALPNLLQQDKEKILDEMWKNLGRIVAEFPHVAKSSPQSLANFVEISQDSLTNIEALKNLGKGGIIFSGHIGNWEVGPKVLIQNGIKVATVYRPLNNPYVEKMTASLRGVEMIEKGSAGSRRIIEVIKEGGFVVILADQKVSEGESVKFFYDDAITATSIARIALRYNIPLVPARIIRKGDDFKFYAEVEKPLVIEKDGDIKLEALSITRLINLKLEEWITQYPSQWFWVHDRWKQ